MIEFQSSILAGTILVRSAVQSPNYVPGVSGWTINQDGSYEFGPGGTFRGNILIVSPSGSSVFGFADANFAEIDFQPPNAAGHTIDPARIYTATPFGLQAQFIFQAPDFDNTGLTHQITMINDGVSTTTAIQANTINIGDSNSVNPNSYISLSSNRVTAGPDAGEIGRGWVTGIGDTGASAPVGNALTAVLTTPVHLFRANRAYEVRIAGRLTPQNAAVTGPGLNITSSAGTTLHTYGRLSTPISLAEWAVPNPNAVFTVGAADLNRSVSLNLISNAAGQTVVHTARRWMNIFDIGDASNFPDAAVMV